MYEEHINEQEVDQEEEAQQQPQLQPWQFDMEAYDTLVHGIANIQVGMTDLQDRQHFIYDEHLRAREEAHKRDYDYRSLFGQLLGHPLPPPYEPPFYPNFPPHHPLGPQ